MSKEKLNFASVTDSELLNKIFFYIRNLRDFVPTLRLRDACSGIMAFLFDLISYLDSKNLNDYGNNEK